MLTYIQVHLYYTFPPVILLYLIYHPLLGRRDGLKLIWLCFMATVYTTPWDNWIISQSGWTYPKGSVLGTIGLVPIEEHLFFLIQPIFLILLHSLISHGRLVPFSIPKLRSKSTAIHTFVDAISGEVIERKTTKTVVQTLPRRWSASSFWVMTFLIGGVMVNEAHGTFPSVIPYSLKFGKQIFYLGWIILWISPVIGWLTWLGGRLGKEGWKTWFIGAAYLCMVDTIAIRAGAWTISCETSLCKMVVPGLPLEEFIFFLVSSYLVLIATSLISHLHTLLLLSPSLPPCPPFNPFAHIGLLGRVAFDPPMIDRNILVALREAEETLRKGSKSFEVAKLAFGRDMRIGLIAIYAWCRVTDDLVDDPIHTGIKHSRSVTLEAIRRHLHASYSHQSTPEDLNTILGDIPNLTPSRRSAFHMFASLIPRLVPIEPFEELCRGYETDMSFTSNPSEFRNSSFKFDKHLPIKTTKDLMTYADDVAGSIASAICYLSWSMLTSHDSGLVARPVEEMAWARSVHRGNMVVTESKELKVKIRTLQKAREMGRALQLVNISRDIAKDAKIGRLYVPLSSFPSARSVLDILIPSTTLSYASYSLPLLDTADSLRESSEDATRDLPKTARGGTRAMSASYFEIAHAIRTQGGEVDEKGVKVAKWRRGWAVAKAFWGGL